MVSFITDIKSKVSDRVQIFMLGLISFLFIISVFDANLSLINLIFLLLPLGIIITAVFILVKNDQLFAAHIVMLVMLFESEARTFFSQLTAYSFFSKSFVGTIDASFIVLSIIALYLIVMLVSYILADDDIFILDYSPIVFALIVFSIWNYFAFGFSATLVTLFIAIIASSYGSMSAALLILLSSVILYPIQMLSMIINNTTNLSRLSFWILAIASFYVVYVIMKQLFNNRDSFFNKRSLN